jgi:hypothetical protein
MRKRRKAKPQSGELYELVLGKHVYATVTSPSEGQAVSFAQSLLTSMSLRGERDKRMIVRLKPVLGPPDDLYELLLTPEGAILTAPAGALRQDHAR